MKSIALATLIMIASTAFGQVRPVQTGDTLTYEAIKPEQQNNQPIVFIKKPDLILKLTIEKNGDRRYDYRGGKNYSITDQDFTRHTKRGEPINGPYRFPLFTPTQKPEAGQKWDIAFRSESAGYGDNLVTYQAIARSGPEFVIFINNIETRVGTIRIDYDGYIRSTTASSWSGTATTQVLYAPALNEIVFYDHIAYDNRGFLLSGFRSTLKAIQTTSE